LIIAIVMASVVGPLAATAAGGGVPGAVVGALASSAANNATVSVINNRGNLGAVVKDVTSSDAMKGYVISGVTAGLTAGFFDGWTGTKTVTSTGVVSVSPGSLSTWAGVGQFAANQVLQSGTSALLSKALGQGGDIGDALKGALFNTLAATSFNAVGDFTQGKLAEGYPPKIVIHAMVGGLLSEATGGDFKTGALAAGINEALVVQLDSLVKGNKILLSMSSQIVGVLAAASQKDADAKSIEKGGWVAKNATDYNFGEHLPAGLAQYGQASTTLAEYMQKPGYHADADAQAQLALAQGQGFDGPQPANEFVKAWAMFMAGELTGVGIAAVLGKMGLWGTKATAIEFLPKATRNSAGQIETNVSQGSAIKTLESNGYMKTISQDGSVTVLTNGEKTYRFYPASTSTGQPSASLTVDGMKKPTAKIRFTEE
jgi:filamentous hemagglutinin